MQSQGRGGGLPNSSSTDNTVEIHRIIGVNASSLANPAPEVQTPVYVIAWVTLVNVILFVTGLIGNAMVTIIVMKMRRMRVPNNFFFANLSIADLLVLIICQPSALLEFYAKDRWYLGTLMCKLVHFLENIAQQTSVLTIAAISVERYNAICRPLRSQYLYSRSRTLYILASIWFTAAVLSCPFAGISVTEEAEFYDGTKVTVCRTKIYLTWHYVYIISLIVAFFLIPLVIIVFLYTRIMFQLTSEVLAIGKRYDHRALINLKLRKHSVYLLIAIILLFFISLLPMRVFALWVVFASLDDLHTLGFEGYLNLLCFVRAMVYFNSATNPVVYSLMSSKFRNAFRSLLRCRRKKKNRSIYVSPNYNGSTPSPSPHIYCPLRNQTHPISTEFRHFACRCR